MTDFKLLINGRLESSDQGLNVINPATEQVISTCPRASFSQLDRAVEAAHKAFPAWSALRLTERRQRLEQIADTLQSHSAELSRLLTLETGKPLRVSQDEVMIAAAITRYFSGQELSSVVLEDTAARRVELHRRPLGVVAAITPWNFPLSILAFKLPPALLAGNTLVLKPAPTAPLATLRFAELIREILPPGVINTITDANDLGADLSADARVRKIAFTGSTATGRKIMANGASTLKRLTLELGGNDAAIVLDDVSPRAIAPQIFLGAFYNSGQTCLALKRLYVHDSLYDEMYEELAYLARRAVVGDGLEPGVELGPLQNREQYVRVKTLLEEARAAGAAVAGGELLDRPGFFIRPAIVRGIREGSKLVDEEQFGPVLPVIRYSDPEEALRRANASPYGLGASVWSADTERAHRMACRMEAGTVWVNTHLAVLPSIPLAGAKQSGIGSELGPEALAEFTQTHIVHVARGTREGAVSGSRL